MDYSFTIQLSKKGADLANAEDGGYGDIHDWSAGNELEVLGGGETAKEAFAPFKDWGLLLVVRPLRPVA